MATKSKCPECGGRLTTQKARAPESDHVATYHACDSCPYFRVERTVQHKATLEPKKATLEPKKES